MEKSTIYYLNNKPVTKDIIKKRKATLISTDVITKKYYEAPLTKDEEEKEKIAQINYYRSVRKTAELREDREKYHG